MFKVTQRLLLFCKRSALVTLIVSRCVCQSTFQNVSSPTVLVGTSRYFNTLFSCMECL